MNRIGIDLGGTNIAAGITDDHGKVLYKMSVPTKSDREPALIIDDIVMLCSNLCKKSSIPLADIGFIGIAIPGGVDEKSGEIIITPNIPFSGINISSILSQRLEGKPVKVINDANAALLAEMKCGVGIDRSNVVMITLGTGIGGAIAIDGKILNGVNGMAGEIGHMVIQKNGNTCSCGRRGCFETYASASALVDLIKQEIVFCKSINEHTLMEEAPRINARVAFDAYKKGDKGAKRVLDQYMKSLSCGIASLINIFQPELFIIGGGISGQKQNLIDMLHPYIQKELFSSCIQRQTEITTAQCENDAGIIGAALLSD